MRNDRSAFVGGLLATLVFVVGCGSGGERGSFAPSETPANAPLLESIVPTSVGAADSSTPAPTSPAAQSSAAALPPGALAIAALGDSLTEGQCDDSGLGGYVGRLQTLIAPLRPGTRIANYGHSGWSSTDLIDGQNGQPSELSQAIDGRPNLALVWIGSNDLWYLYEFGPDPMTSDAERQDLAAYETNVDTILRGLTSHGTTVFIALLDDQSKRPVVADPPNPAEPAFPATTAADLVRMSAQVKAYNDAIRRKAAQYGAITVDFYDTTIFTDPATLCGDGNHPNIAGYDRVAQVWFAALAPRLK